MKSYDISELIDFTAQPDGSMRVEPKAAPLRGQYFRDTLGRLTCKHGTILYGRGCITCEREAFNGSSALTGE